jgi:hypothetical protein
VGNDPIHQFALRARIRVAVLEALDGNGVSRDPPRDATGIASFDPTSQRRIENTTSTPKNYDCQRDAERLLIRSPLIGNLLQKLMLVDETFLDEQLGQRVGLCEAGDKNLLA